MQLNLTAVDAMLQTLRQHPHLVVMDTEQTCWEGVRERAWSGPNEMREIIQVGAVLVDTINFSEIAVFEVVVKPVKNPQLSDFCIELTGITQAGRKGGPRF